METFTLGTAIGLNMNATFYADSVNAAAWNKVRLFFFSVGCVFAGNVGSMYSCRFIKSTRLKSFQRERKASTVHEQSKYWQYWSVFFD